MAGAAGSELSRGGMTTKIDAGKIATAAGTRDDHRRRATRINPLAAIDRGARSHLVRAAAQRRCARARPGSPGQLEPARHAHRRRRRGRRAAVRQEPAARRRARGHRRFRARRRGRHRRAATAARSRAGLSPTTPTRPADRRAKSGEIEAILGYAARVGDGPSRRHGADAHARGGSRGCAEGERMLTTAERREDIDALMAEIGRGARRRAAARHRLGRAQARRADRDGRRDLGARGTRSLRPTPIDMRNGEEAQAARGLPRPADADDDAHRRDGRRRRGDRRRCPIRSARSSPNGTGRTACTSSACARRSASSASSSKAGRT